MAIGDIKVFTINQNGLILSVQALDLGGGQTQFNVTGVAGKGDLNAIWWADGDATVEGNTTLSKSDNALNMNGTTIAWDGYTKLSSAGLGPAGESKSTFITAGETLTYAATVSWADVNALGVRATSVNGGDSIKGTDGAADSIVLLPTISINDVCVLEGGKAEFTVTLSNAYLYDITVTYGTSANAGTESDDFTPASGTVTILAGQTTATVCVQTTQDAVYELNETFSVNLSGGSANIPGPDIAVTISDATGVGTIKNDDAAPQFSIDDVTVSEADGTITFTVTKAGATEESSSVDYAVAPDSAGTPGDYTANDALASTLAFLAADTNKSITLNITNDLTSEATEQFFVNLSNAVTATISDNQGIGMITDNDPAGPTFGPTLIVFPAANTGDTDPNNNNEDNDASGAGGRQIINGNDDPNTIYGGAGNDDLFGGGGNDTIYGGSGNDNPVNGDDGDDVIHGGSGNDQIDGGANDDTIYGGTGNDNISGGTGADTIYGGSGNDQVNGNAGADNLYGGFGTDAITADAADTIYYLSASDTNDTIGGFVS